MHGFTLLLVDRLVGPAARRSSWPRTFCKACSTDWRIVSPRSLKAF